MKAWQQIRSALQGEKQRFLQAALCAEETQQQVLTALLQRHQHTRFGREYAFAAAHDAVQCIQQLPIRDYSGLKPWIDASAAGERQALIADLSHFESTGGSSGGSKLIPYGAAGMAAYQAALFPWMDDLLQSRPSITKGRAYWSISPALSAARSTSGNIPIGLGNDALYFGEVLAESIQQTLAVSAKVAAYTVFADWQLTTLKQLLMADDLRLISVWSPSFLLLLLQGLESRFDTLVEQLPHNIAQRLLLAMQSGSLDTRVLWPKLDTISCWTQGSAQQFVPALQQRFPHAYIQGKGLLATEAVVSLPLHAAADPVLAIRSGYYEFRDTQGRLHSLSGLCQSEVYEVIVTNDLGMYRYALGDLVEVSGWYQQLPCLRFVGRQYSVDLVGEKLHEGFVTRVLRSQGGFSLLCAQADPVPGYIVLTDNESLDVLQIELRLRKNPQYDYARRLGQLRSLRYMFVPGLNEFYHVWRQQAGQGLGDIKPRSLLGDERLLTFIKGRA